MKRLQTEIDDNSNSVVTTSTPSFERRYPNKRKKFKNKKIVYLKNMEQTNLNNSTEVEVEQDFKLRTSSQPEVSTTEFSTEIKEEISAEIDQEYKSYQSTKPNKISRPKQRRRTRSTPTTSISFEKEAISSETTSDQKFYTTTKPNIRGRWQLRKRTKSTATNSTLELTSLKNQSSSDTTTDNKIRRFKLPKIRSRWKQRSRILTSVNTETEHAPYTSSTPINTTIYLFSTENQESSSEETDKKSHLRSQPKIRRKQKIRTKSTTVEFKTSTLINQQNMSIFINSTPVNPNSSQLTTGQKFHKIRPPKIRSRWKQPVGIKPVVPVISTADNSGIPPSTPDDQRYPWVFIKSTPINSGIENSTPNIQLTSKVTNGYKLRPPIIRSRWKQRGRIKPLPDNIKTEYSTVNSNVEFSTSENQQESSEITTNQIFYMFSPPNFTGKIFNSYPINTTEKSLIYR